MKPGPVSFFYPRRFLSFGVFLALFVTGPLLAQKSPKETAKISLGAHFQISVANASSATTYRTLWTDPTTSTTIYDATASVAADPTVAPVQSTPVMEQITPGRLYLLTISSPKLNSVDLQFNQPPGYQIFIANGGSAPMTPHTTIAAGSFGGTSGSMTIYFYIAPNDRTNFLAPGYARAPRIADVTWAVSVGSLADGTTAGALRWQSTTVAQNLLDASSLNYVSPNASEIYTYSYSDGTIKYIGTNQVQIYVRRNSGTNSGYKIEVYDPTVSYSYPGGDPTQPWTFASADEKEYTISNPDSSWLGRVKINKLDRASGLNEDWILSQSGGTTTVTQTSSLRVITETSTSGPGTGQRTAVITVADASSTVAVKRTRVYQTYPWGEELLTDTADPDGLALTTTYDYYNTTSGDGHYTKLKSVKNPDGSWAMYDYYDDFARWGEVAAVYKPWQDAPTDPSTATLTNCQVTAYSYAGERSIFQELSAGSQTTINGVVAAKTVDVPSVATNSAYSEPVRTDTVQAYSSASLWLTTVTKTFHNTADLAYNGKLYSQTNPDGTKVAASYLTGDLTNNTHGTSWSSTVVTPSGTAGTWCETYLFGTATQSDCSAVQYSTDGMTGGKAIDPVWMVPNRSYRRQVFRNAAGNPIFDMTQVFTGSAFQLISWQECAYTTDGLVTSCRKSTGEYTTYSYTNGKVSTQTNPDGTSIQNTFDALMRVTKSEKAAASGYSGYPSQGAIDTNYAYDAAGHVLTATVQPAAGGTSLTSTATYNLAGLPTGQTDPTGLSSTVAYANGGRTVTTTLPNGGTQIADRHLDGTSKSATGTAAISQYYGCAVNADGTISCQTNIGSSTSTRVATTTTDWLGRSIAQVAPGFGGGTLKSQAFYNSMGQLIKTVQPGMTPTLYQYDNLGELQYSGLDVDNNGVLDLAGMDRITQTRTQILSQGGAWWVQTLTSTYNQANNAAPLLQSESRQKLVPYDYTGGNYDGGTVLTETDGYDLFRNLTVQKMVGDRTHAVVTQTTTLPDSSAPQIAVAYNWLLVSQTSAQNITTTVQYDALGRQTSMVDPRTGTSHTSYYTSGTGSNGQVSSTQDAAGNTTSYAYDSTNGLLASTTDPLSNSVYHSYDRLGREIKTWGAGTYPVAYAFDSLGQKIAMRTFRDISINFSTATWPLSDDGSDPLAPDPSSWTSGDKTTWAYDGPTGLATNKTDASSHAVGYSYNTNNQLATRTWSRGTTASYAYDPATAEQTGITYSDGTPNLTYTFNRSGQTSTVTDVTGARAFSYSTATTELQSENLPTYFGSHIIARKYETTTSGAIGRAKGYTLGTSSVPAVDGEITYGYDTYGRLNGVALTGGPSFVYGFVANSNLISGVSDSGSGWTQTRTWLSNRDLLGSIETKFSTTSIGKFQYVSDALGRRTSKVSTGALYARYSAGGLAEDYTYNARSELTGAETYESTDPSVTTTPMLGRNFTYAYDQIGSRTSSSVDGTSTTYTNNALNELTQRTVPGNVSVSGLAQTGATVTINGTAVTSGEQQGQYYQHNASVTNTSAPQYTSYTVASSLGGSYLRNNFLAQTPEAYTYDADGNLLTDGRWHYDWDAENRLVTMETIGNRSGDPTAIWTSGVTRQKITFSYDYLSRRVAKKLYSWSGSAWVAVTSMGETRFVYDGWNLIGDYDSTGGTFGVRLRSYVWGLDLSWSLQGGGGVGGLLATVTASGLVNMAVHDGNGNIMGLTDRSTGTVNAAYEYSPFGETLRSTGLYAQQNPFRFSSQYTDDETGLICYGRRYYDPKTGRWFSRDPKEELGGLHLFAFCKNNPVNHWDFLGFDACGWGGEGFMAGASSFSLGESTPAQILQNALDQAIIESINQSLDAANADKMAGSLGAAADSLAASVLGVGAADDETSSFSAQSNDDGSAPTTNSFDSSPPSNGAGPGTYPDGTPLQYGTPGPITTLDAWDDSSQSLSASISALTNTAGSTSTSSGGSGDVSVGPISIQDRNGNMVPLGSAAGDNFASVSLSNASGTTTTVGGLGGTTVADLANSTVGLGSEISTKAAQELQAAGMFAMSGNTYKMGFYGNQAVGYSAAEVAAAKSTQAVLATAGRVITVGGTALGVGLSVIDVYKGGASNQSLVKGFIGIAGTASAFIPVVGPVLAVGISITNAAGGFNWIYNNFDNTPRLGTQPIQPSDGKR